MTTWRRIPTIGGTIALLTATALLIYAQQPADPPSRIGSEPPSRIGSEPPLFLAVDVAPPGTATFSTLFSFDGTDGAYPSSGALGQATNGDLYGTTYVGGPPSAAAC
jgi:hypothetical protein